MTQNLPQIPDVKRYVKVFISSSNILTMSTHSFASEFSQIFQQNITSNDCSYGYPIIYTYTIHNAILSKDTLTMLDTTKLII